ncbi:MAG: hypothetical protein Q8T11_10410 [Elusimicrobiota bacterium]|nr:hypothetical protein [Elusimicrobiota bacterium]
MARAAERYRSFTGFRGSENPGAEGAVPLALFPRAARRRALTSARTRPKYTVTASSGVPSSLLERDTDGTTRRFDVFESTSILRLALLTDKNGNTVTYNRDGQGRLTNVVDIHGRFFNLTYNPAGLVATLTDSGGRKKLGPLSGSLIFSPARATQSWLLFTHTLHFSHG